MRYGANKGKYECEVQFESDTSGSNVTMPLGDEVSRRLLAIVAEELMKASKEVAEALTNEVIAAPGKLLGSDDAHA